MTTVAIVPENSSPRNPGFRAFCGDRQSQGATPGQALDALTSQLGEPLGTALIIVQPMCPDRWFTAAQQQRLAELMGRWREARDKGNTLSPGERGELDGLVEAELRAASQRSLALTQQLPS